MIDTNYQKGIAFLMQPDLTISDKSMMLHRNPTGKRILNTN